MDARALQNHLVHWCREELAGLGRMIAALDEQAASAALRAPDRLEAASKLIEAEIQAEGARAKRRLQLFTAFAAHFGVPLAATTLGSIVARLGADAGDLADLRRDLRSTAAELVLAQRRTRRTLAMHRDVTREILAGVLTRNGANPLEGGGALIDAEA